MCLADKKLMFYNSLYVDFRAVTQIPHRDKGCVIIYYMYSIYNMLVHHTFHVLDPVLIKRCIDKKIP